MSGKERAETAARAEQHGLHSVAMTDEEDHYGIEIPHVKDEALTTEDDEARPRGSELIISLAQALHRAAGLPTYGLYQEDPYIAGYRLWGEARWPILDSAIPEILLASQEPNWHNPRAVEAELEAVRRALKRLKNRIASLDEETLFWIDYTEVPGAMNAGEDFYLAPDEERTVPVALSAIGALDAAIVLTIEDLVEASEELPTTGRIPNIPARKVAYSVAKYLKDVTGDIPALWTGMNPSGPFAHALLAVFKILDIKADIQRPGEWAISKLTAEL